MLANVLWIPDWLLGVLLVGAAIASTLYGVIKSRQEDKKLGNKGND